jgi:hypothetical protein
MLTTLWRLGHVQRTIASLIKAGLLQQGFNGCTRPIFNLSPLAPITTRTRGKEFESHKAAKIGILGLIHHTHPAAAELLNDAVMRYGLADQSKTSLLGTNLRVDTLPSQRPMHLEIK